MTVQTPLGPDVLLLTGFEGAEEISSLFSIKLDLIAQKTRKGEVAFDKLLGREMTIRMDVPGGGPRYLSGICCQFAQGSQDETFTSYQAEIVPKLWLLTRKVRSRIFQHLSVPEILKQVFEGMEVNYHFTRIHESREYCVQYRESDFDFVSRLMEDEGIFYHFRHKENGHQLVVSDTHLSHHPVSAPVKALYNVNEMDERGLRVHQWIKRQHLRSGKVALWDSNFQLPGNNLHAQKHVVESVPVGSVSHKLNVGGNGHLELYDYPAGFAKRFDAIDRHGGDQQARLQKVFEDNERMARIRMGEEAAEALLIEGSSNCSQFVSGHKFTLERHFDAAGEYVLKSVRHEAKCGSAYRSNETARDSYKNSFVCFPIQVEFRPRRKTPKPIIHGVQTAFVVGPPDKEVHIDKHARVKVQFQWDREGERNDASSCWVRVSQAWAGPNFGGLNHPRIGQEVIVDFVEGDPDHPIVTGRVYHAGNMPPPSNAGREDSKVRRSRDKATAKKQNADDIKKQRAERKQKNAASTPVAKVPPVSVPKSASILAGAEQRMAPLPENRFNKFPTSVVDTIMMSSLKSSSLDGKTGNNEITMNDAGGSEGLFVKAQKDNINTVGNDRETTIGNDDLEKIGNDRVKTIGNDETNEIGNDRQETVGNDETIEIGNDRHETVGNNEDIEIGNDRTEQVGNDEKITIGHDRIEKVGNDEDIQITGKRTEKVGKDEDITIVGKRIAKVQQTEAITIGQGRTRTVAKGDDATTISAGNRSVNVKGTNKISSTNDTEMKSETRMLLEVGAASITLTPEQIVLKIGGSTITMTAGNITAVADKIDLNPS